MSHKFLKPPVFLVPIILGTGILFAQDTTYLSLPSASVNQYYHNVDIQVNQDCNGCMCPVGEPLFDTEIISFPDWLDTVYVTFFPDTSAYYYYYGGSYQLVLSGTPMDEAIGSGTIILHEYISFDAWDGYYENATWEFTDVYIINLEVVEEDHQIGDECIAWNGEAGFYDCEMCCWPSDPDWLGDGYCDYMGGCGWEGPLYNCPELGYDCGDCNAYWDGSDPLGYCGGETVTYEGILFYNTYDTDCQDTCVEFTLELIDDVAEVEIISESITACEEMGEVSEYGIVVDGSNIIFYWQNAEIQCCVEPLWNGSLEPDNNTDGTFHLEFADAGEPCDCMCEFDMSVTIGPFSPGTYTLEFSFGGYSINWTSQTFTIEDSRDWIWVTTLGNPESLMPYNNHHVIISGYETWCVECGGLVPEEITDLGTDCSPGDANGDGQVNILDVVALVNAILYTDEFLLSFCADLNSDGVFDIMDIVEIVIIIL
jgi:hypothetical protein